LAKSRAGRKTPVQVNVSRREREREKIRSLKIEKEIN
jgi:hypothetical protein